jgi:hypothetical protein
MRYLTLLTLVASFTFSSPALGQDLSGASVLATGYVDDFAPPYSPSPPFSYLSGGELYMLNSSPQVSWFNTAVPQGPGANGALGYNIYENTNGVLELNVTQPDTQNNYDPQTECQFDFLGGPFVFSCFAGVSFGWATAGDFQVFDPFGLPNRRKWVTYDDGAGDLTFDLQDDSQADGYTWMSVSTNDLNRPDHVSVNVPLVASVAYTPACDADWSGNPPATIQEALDRIAAKIGPIP